MRVGVWGFGFSLLILFFLPGGGEGGCVPKEYPSGIVDTDLVEGYLYMGTIY